MLTRRDSSSWGSGSFAFSESLLQIRTRWWSVSQISRFRTDERLVSLHTYGAQELRVQLLRVVAQPWQMQSEGRYHTWEKVSITKIVKAKARNCASSYSLHILHELLQLFMDREIFEAENLFICLSICLGVMFRDGGHHLVCSIIPDAKKNPWNLIWSILTWCWAHLWIASSVILSFTVAGHNFFSKSRMLA